MVAHASGSAGEVRADGKAPGADGSAAADIAPRKWPQARMGSRPESLMRGASRLVEELLLEGLLGLGVVLGDELGLLGDGAV